MIEGRLKEDACQTRKQEALLLQVGRDDEYVSQGTGIALWNAIPDRNRTLRAYGLDHALEDETAHEDRITAYENRRGLAPVSG